MPFSTPSSLHDDDSAEKEDFTLDHNIKTRFNYILFAM